MYAISDAKELKASDETYEELGYTCMLLEVSVSAHVLVLNAAANKFGGRSSPYQDPPLLGGRLDKRTYDVFLRMVYPTTA